MEKAISSPYIDNITNIRVLVLVEAEPCSNHYHQIQLTREQYVKLLNHLEGNFVHRDGGFDVVTTDDVCLQLPDLKPYA